MRTIKFHLSVPKCSSSVSRTDSSWGWGGATTFTQEEVREDGDYDRDYSVDNNIFESEFDAEPEWENSNRGVRPGEIIDEDMGAFTSERTTTKTRPPTTTSTTTTTTRRITTTTRRKTFKPGTHGTDDLVRHHLNACPI